MQGKSTWFRLMPCWYFLECVLYWANWHLNPHPQFRYTLVVIKTSMTYLDKFRSSGHGCSMQCWYAHDTEIVHLQKRLEIVVLVSAQRSATLYLKPGRVASTRTLWEVNALCVLRNTCCWDSAFGRVGKCVLSLIGRVEKSAQSNVCKGMVITRTAVQACSNHHITISVMC